MIFSVGNPVYGYNNTAGIDFYGQNVKSIPAL